MNLLHFSILCRANHHSPQTKHFLSTEEFEILSKHPPLISNIARGPVIDTDALVKALHSGSVAAATLDVTEPEPLPEDHPLWDAPNVTITPHISGSSINYGSRAFDILKINIERLNKGEKLVNLISRKKGY
jgi:phosphoglycerate dehydrogenase-like enzyme